MEMEEDARITIIIGKHFFTTTGAMIDVKNDKLSLQLGNEKLEFDFVDPILMECKVLMITNTNVIYA